MPPTTVKKTSVRLSPEAIAILEAYVTTYNCTQTAAINEIILASATTHTHPGATQEPPSIATQWQRSIEVRLAKLEAATQEPPSIATHSDKDSPSFEVGQEIDGQSSKTYKMLRNSPTAIQKIDNHTYILSNELGMICRVLKETSRSGKKKLKVIATFPGDPVVIREDGTFLSYNSQGLLEWFTESEIAALAEATAPTELVNDEIAIDAVEVASLPQNEPAVEPLTEVVAPLVETATLVPPTRLAKGELLERFATKLNNPGQLNTLKGNLDSVGLPKLGKGWTAQFDPEGKAWMPEDASREYWVEQPMEVAS